MACNVHTKALEHMHLQRQLVVQLHTLQQSSSWHPSEYLLAATLYMGSSPVIVAAYRSAVDV